MPAITTSSAGPSTQRVEQVERSAALDRLRSGDLDLAVVWTLYSPDGVDARDGFERVRLGDDPYRVVLPPTHRLAGRRRVRLAELAGERFNGPPAEGYSRGYREMLERLCADAGFRPDVRVPHGALPGRRRPRSPRPGRVALTNAA